MPASNRRMEMTDVLSLGEMLVDWICTTRGAPLSKAKNFTMAAGGAPANTAIGLARLGVRVGFIGAFSEDEFGAWLYQILCDEHVNVGPAQLCSNVTTRHVHVLTTADGDRQMIAFSRVRPADAYLDPSKIRPEFFKGPRVLHFGSISMIAPTSLAATNLAVRYANQNRLLVSFDPNIRLALWESKEHCIATVKKALKSAHVVKVSQEELEMLTNSRSIVEAAQALRLEYGIKLLLVTMGENGSMFVHRSGTEIKPPFPVCTVDSTGAGDAFNAGIISGLLEYANRKVGLVDLIDELPLPALRDIVLRANATGAMACTIAGAIPALPTSVELEDFLRHHLSAAPVAGR
jgi:fructokinase